jgi:lipopolysaccharide/colanic/teichoic acid biosynthesis glycosyltransferase
MRSQPRATPDVPLAPSWASQPFESLAHDSGGWLPLHRWAGQDGQLLVAIKTPRWKRLVDVLVAAAVVLLSLPLTLILMALVKLTSHGPAIFKQRRVGERGKIFTLYKLRSMRHDAEAVSGPTWAVPNDPRVTRLGRFLRRWHLDELTEFWNVLKGDMSLVGPRPERPEFVVQLAEQIPGYVNRLAVKPGITGLAQILLPADRTLDDVRRKLTVDLYYLTHQSVWLDVRILLATALRGAGLPWPVCWKICAIPRPKEPKPHRDEALLPRMRVGS